MQCVVAATATESTNKKKTVGRAKMHGMRQNNSMIIHLKVISIRYASFPDIRQKNEKKN